jgi:hypothetical protein
MEDLDLTELVTNFSTTLQLQNNTQYYSQNDHLHLFTKFPDLPTELRLKIFSHALPTYNTVDVNAHIILADPSFGIYFTFSTTSEAKESKRITSFTSTVAPIPEFKSTRFLNLLSVNKECREFYLQHFPHWLPTGSRGKGRIRFSPLETVFIWNLDNLICDPDFKLLRSGNYELQSWWRMIETLAVQMASTFWWLEKEMEEFSRVLRFFGNLKEVRGILWFGFYEGVMDEGGRVSMRDSWGWEVDRLRVKLVKYQEEEDPGYVVPEIKLI